MGTDRNWNGHGAVSEWEQVENGMTGAVSRLEQIVNGIELAR